VQVGTATFLNPHAPLEILRGLQSALQESGLGSIEALIGSLRPYPADPSFL